MTTEQHKVKLAQKREERKKKDSEDSPSEKRELVMDGAKLKCEFADGLGELKITSNEILLQDKLIATEGDGNNMINLQFKGKCNHPKWPAQNMSPPPCMSVIKLTPWQKLGTGFMQNQKVLVKESTITCTPDFNSAVAKLIPKVESIKSELEEKVIMNGFFYTKDGEYLGKIGSNTDVYVTDKGTFDMIKSEKSVDASKIIFITDISKLNNEQFLNRANWVFGEGGGAFADKYAMTIKNLRNSGRSGYGPKPFNTDEEMYKATMSHGNPPKTLYPDYLNGTYPGSNAKAFAIAKRNYTDLNKNPKMNLAIKAVINSITESVINEGYNNWRGSGDKLYTEEEKRNVEKEKNIPKYDELKQKTGKVYAKIKTIIDHYWEPVGKKYRRHSFRKITKENV